MGAAVPPPRSLGNLTDDIAKIILGEGEDHPAHAQPLQFSSMATEEALGHLADDQGLQGTEQSDSPVTLRSASYNRSHEPSNFVVKVIPLCGVFG